MTETGFGMKVVMMVAAVVGAEIQKIQRLDLVSDRLGVSISTCPSNHSFIHHRRMQHEKKKMIE
jgi:hypothetical protein